MYKCKMLMVLALGLAISVGGLSGCAGKKKTTEPVKQVEKTPEEKPTPPAITPKAPEKQPKSKEK